MNNGRHRAPRNRTITLSDNEEAALTQRLIGPPLSADPDELANKIVRGDTVELLDHLPRRFVDLLVLDPPYNLSKRFGSETFRQMSLAEYEEWFQGWFVRLLPSH